MRNPLALALAFVAIGVWASGAVAFHDGGVAECAGCHTMHNSQDGVSVTGNETGYENLLVAANSTDACLSCHAGYGQFDGGFGYGPGGDFYWVTKTFSWSAHGHDAFSTGDSHGHNVISPGYGIMADATLMSAPGGDFDADWLTCTSCHDPHGNQNFRILYGDELGPLYISGRYEFDAPAPLAVGNSRRTNAEDGWETDEHHTVYKSGMSEWCANCHTDIHSGNTNDYVHGTSEELDELATVYSYYESSDNQTGGDPAFSYWGLVPFEDVDVDLATVDPANYTQGPAAHDQVMCLSCHRAHASAFPDIGRWDFTETFIADSHPDSDDMGATADDVNNKYYLYTFVQNQRSLCNKCHVKDAFDAPYN